MNGNFKQQLNKKCNKVRAGKWEVYKSAQPRNTCYWYLYWYKSANQEIGQKSKKLGKKFRVL